MNPWRGLGNLPKAIWILSFATFIDRLGMMALPFLVLYLTKGLGFSATDAGLVLTSYGIGALAASPFSGRLSDYIGPAKVIKLSFFLSAFILALYPFAPSYTLIFVITILWSIVSSALRPAALALIMDMVTPNQRKAAYSVLRLAINLGMSVGPAAGGFLLLISYKLIFWVDAATSLCAGILIAFSSLGSFKRHGEDQPSDISEQGLLMVFNDKRFFYFLIAILPSLIIFFQHQAALPLVLVHTLTLPESTYGLLFTVNTGIIILLEIPLNLRMADWQHRHSLALGALLIGAGFGSMIFATGMAGVLAATVIWTFGEMILLPGAAAYMGEIAPANRRGTYMGFYQMSFYLALSAAAWIGTTTLEHFGAPTLWIGTFVAGILSAMMLSRVYLPSDGKKV